jgi:hypothetical protein
MHGKFVNPVCCALLWRFGCPFPLVDNACGHVRFWGHSRHRHFIPSRQLMTRSGHLLPSIGALRKVYSITLSAMASSDGGTVRPSAFAVVRLMASSNLVDCITGILAGFSPLRIRPA